MKKKVKITVTVAYNNLFLVQISGLSPKEVETVWRETAKKLKRPISKFLNQENDLIASIGGYVAGGYKVGTKTGTFSGVGAHKLLEIGLLTIPKANRK